MNRSEACILCQTPITHSVAESEGYRICRKCDITWCLLEDPDNPADEWEKDYYGRSDILRLHESRRSGMEAIVRRLSSVYPHRGRLLDVGAGIGILMHTAARDGWLVEGVEPSKSAAERAGKLTGATVYNGLLEELELSEGYYDAVTILDILRSVPDPIKFLCCARRLLRPGGVLLIREVYRAVWQKWRWFKGRSLGNSTPEPRRRAFEYAQCFSPKSLLYAFRLVGLEGWIEPSPVFIEPAGERRFLASVSKQAIGLASNGLYKASARRLIISPNLLGFGRAPGLQSVSTRSAA